MKLTNITLSIATIAIGPLIAITSATLVAQEPDTKSVEPAKSAVEVATEKRMQELLKAFEKRMSSSKLIGQFTITGMENEKPRIEEYHILSVRKLEKGDYWELKARIKYGDHDITWPIQVEVKWAGGTPVITVDRLTIPRLGTFDARVLIRKQQYAGTWSHDAVGGHMFGRIEKLTEEDLKNQPSRKKKTEGADDK